MILWDIECYTSLHYLQDYYYMNMGVFRRSEQILQQFLPSYSTQRVRSRQLYAQTYEIDDSKLNEACMQLCEHDAATLRRQSFDDLYGSSMQAYSKRKMSCTPWTVGLSLINKPKVVLLL